uniref:LIM zinc-binding domain-containing protein n=1 Tax=Steinernema glaseri TaxID=37863 RepID=A0A1I7ZDF9_9BILA
MACSECGGPVLPTHISGHFQGRLRLVFIRNQCFRCVWVDAALWLTAVVETHCSDRSQSPSGTSLPHASCLSPVARVVIS